QTHMKCECRGRLQPRCHLFWRVITNLHLCSDTGKSFFRYPIRITAEHRVSILTFQETSRKSIQQCFTYRYHTVTGSLERFKKSLLLLLDNLAVFFLKCKKVPHPKRTRNPWY